MRPPRAAPGTGADAPRGRPRACRRWLAGLALVLAAALLPIHAQPGVADESLQARDQRLIEAALSAMPAQRPGQPDLYVLGFAGDGHEDVFRNEVLYLEQLMRQRFDAHVLTLVNHPDSLEEDAPRPLATLDNLRHALAGIGAAMDTDEDLLLLFVTTHGSEDHELSVQLAPFVEEAIAPEQLAAALEDAGIRNRVVVVSACYSGGFLPALRGRDALVIAAARKDRTSFGCGAASHVTYFGQAWLVDGLNRHTDFVAAYRQARKQIAARERADGFTPSLPQISVGKRIGGVLDAWEAGLQPGAAVPYPYAAPPPPARTRASRRR